jgi:hypothetical protein
MEQMRQNEAGALTRRSRRRMWNRHASMHWV